MVLKPLGKHFWVLGVYGDSLGKYWSRCVFSTALSALSKEAVQFWEEQTPPRKGVIVHLALGVVSRDLAGLIYRSVECWSWLPKQVPLFLGLLRQAATSVRARPFPNHTHLSFPSLPGCWHTCSCFALALAGTGWPASFLEYTHWIEEATPPFQTAQTAGPRTVPNFDSLLYFWTSISDTFHT